MVILSTVGESLDPGPAIRTGVDLAGAYDDELKVLHVIPERDADEHFRSLQEFREFGDLSWDVELDRAAEVAEEYVGSVLGDDVPEFVSPLGRTGDPAKEIVSTAETLDARFVVIAGRKRSPAGKAVFGSTTQAVILNADRPVVTVMADS